MYVITLTYEGDSLLETMGTIKALPGVVNIGSMYAEGRVEKPAEDDFGDASIQRAMKAERASADLLDDLARRLAHAKNYLYEATMGDYSQASIDRGQSALNEILGIIHSYGLVTDQLVEWSDERGLWTPIKNEGDNS